jgi:hypothetical protein
VLDFPGISPLYPIYLELSRLEVRLIEILKETKMRITKLLLICMCCVMVAPAVWGQTASGQSKAGILGYLDPHTGAFRPVPSAEEGPDVPAALTTFGGTITVTLTITVKSTGITNVTCTAEVSVADSITTTSPRFLTESNAVAATGTGAARSCKLTIPYSWALATQTSDNMGTSYFVSASGATNGLPQRTSSLSPLDTRKVPANGTITALTAAVTI